MPIDLSRLGHGLYVITRPKFGVITHVALLDVGNQLGLQVPRGSEAVVVHQPPSGLCVAFLSAAGSWKTVQRVASEAGVRQRVSEAFRNPKYDLLGNNCEHFLNFALKGERTSPQLGAGATVAGLLVLIAVLGSD